MIDFNFTPDPRKGLIDELFDESDIIDKCVHIRRDNEGNPYCGRDLQESDNIEIARYGVCDTYSLQFFCLNGPEGHNKCIFYNGEPF